MEGSVKYEVKSLDPQKVAVISGILHFCLTALFCIPMAFFMHLGRTPFTGSVFIRYIVFFLPFVYGIIGFLLGAFMSFLYNILASRVGGVVLDLKKTK
jgi:hypothetical protein